MAHDQEHKNKRWGMRRWDYIFAGGVIVSGGLFFGSFSLAVMSGITAVVMWFTVLCGCILFITAIGVFAVTVHTIRALALVITVACLPILLCGASVLHGAIFVVGIGLLLYGLHVMRRTMRNVLVFDSWLVVRSGVLYVMAALIIMTSSYYYLYLKKHLSDDTILQISPTVRSAIVDRAMSPSDVSQDPLITVDDYLQMIVRHHIIQDGIPAATDVLTLQWMHTPTHPTVEYTVAQLREMVGHSLGRTVHGTDLARDVFTDMIDMYVFRLINRHHTFHAYRVEVFGTTFFIVAMALSPVLRVAAMVMIQLSIFLLRRYGVLRTVCHTARVKTITL